ncbi:hypothetical protein RRF57_001816 [Xylaria bambusicola]|uniref:Uncharacterized protein n=1 Tax=Xylaria bambusicola TaxID=326684 RepID=A0AAN7UHS6_9PEZI
MRLRGLYTVQPDQSCTRDILSQKANLHAAAYSSRRASRLHIIPSATIYDASYEFKITIKADITKKLEGDRGQTLEVVAARSIEGLESGLELIATNTITSACTMKRLERSLKGGC